MRIALRLGLFCLLVGVSFSAGHLAGLAWYGRLYTPLMYDSLVLRGVGSAQYLHKFDHWQWDETSGYARYTREALRGEWLGNTVETYQTYIRGSLPSGVFWYKDRLGPIVLAQVARLFSLTVPAAFLAADFLFPALLAACLLLVGRQLFPSPGHWVVAASLVVWFGVSDVAGLIYQIWGAPHFGPVFGRTTYPQVSGILFVLFLLVMLRVHRKASLSAGAALAGTLALNFYTYVYSWTFAGTMLAAWLLLLMAPYTRLAAAGGHNPRRVGAVVTGAGLLAATAAVPVWLPLFTRPPVVEDFMARLSGEVTRRPDLSLVPPVVLMLAVTLLAHRRGWEHGWLWTSFWLAGLMVMNQQVISGRSMQPFHYLSYFVGPFAALFVFDLVCWRLGSRRVPAGFVLAVVAVGFGQCVWRLVQPMRSEKDLHTVDAAFEEVVSALGKPSLQQYGFLTNGPFLNAVLPAYVAQKPLEPWLTNPLSNAEMSALHHAAAEALGEIPTHGLKIGFDPARVLLVLNRRRRIHMAPADCQVVLSNQDFLVATLSPCGS